MRFRYLLIFTTVCTLSAGLIISCKKKDDAVSPDNSFDRVALLTNLGNNIIIPNYQSLVNAVNKLDSAITAFNANPNASNLTNLQNIFKDSYRAWQYCSVFEIGPADTEFLRANSNTFPTDTTRINTNVSSGTYSLAAAANLAAKGFPGLDYLLFGTGADNAHILAKYTTDANATNRKKYLKDLSAELKTNTTFVLNSWLLSTDGNYIKTFISASGTDVGSSLGLLINQLNLDLDILKNNKLGIPLGKQSNGAQLINKTEAFYSGISAELALIELQTMQNIYLGKSTVQGDGVGLDDYLIQLNSQYNGGTLNDAIKNQFATAITKLQAVPDPLSNTILNNTTVVNSAYTEAQKLLVLLKTDMPSALGVQITYADNDGD